VRAVHPELAGFLWQGRQSEGLVCNVEESIWGHGGKPERALESLRGFLRDGTSPTSVLSASEEDSRREFMTGKALFMRNWPYAWDEAEKRGSTIRGKVGIAPLPTETGEPGPGALGGWDLVVRAGLAPAKRDAAVELVRFLTAPPAERLLAERYGRNPPRTALYEDPQLVLSAPHVVALLPFLQRARARPRTPYYSLLSDTLQSEFSAAVSQVRPVTLALLRIRAKADFLLGLGP
jgi:multiple sugar transport system substrate-binding protein